MFLVDWFFAGLGYLGESLPPRPPLARGTGSLLSRRNHTRRREREREREGERERERGVGGVEVASAVLLPLTVFGVFRTFLLLLLLLLPPAAAAAAAAVA